MTKADRNLVSLAVMVLVALAYTRIAPEYMTLEWWAGLAGLIAIAGLPVTAFVELPKDPWPRLRRSRG